MNVDSLQEITWQDIVTLKYNSSTDENDTFENNNTHVKVVLSDELLDLLEALDYGWNSSPYLPRKSITSSNTRTSLRQIFLDYQKRMYVRLFPKTKTLSYGTLGFAKAEGYTLYKMKSCTDKSSIVQSRGVSDESTRTCPLCGEFGTDLVFKFYCTNSKCANYHE